MIFSYQLEHVLFYYGEQLALSLDKLEIESGKTVALIGENGSGKSTLLAILAFLELASQGKLLFYNALLNKKKLISYRRRVGFLAQKPFMLQGTVLDNINLALKIQAKKQPVDKIMYLLEQLNIAHCAYQSAKQLSGGELQKAALARILILEPEVLLLDEPFSYLDEDSSKILTDFIADYAKTTGNTLIFSTHDRLQGLALADQVVALANGKQVDTPLINLFKGAVREHVFYSGSLQIILTDAESKGSHISICPQDIVLSADAIVSSMRNHFQGRVVMIAEEHGCIRVNVDTGVIFQVLITYQALKELQLQLGAQVWVNFKSNSVLVF